MTVDVDAATLAPVKGTRRARPVIVSAFGLFTRALDAIIVGERGSSTIRDMVRAWYGSLENPGTLSAAGFPTLVKFLESVQDEQGDKEQDHVPFSELLACAKANGAAEDTAVKARTNSLRSSMGQVIAALRAGTDPKVNGKATIEDRILSVAKAARKGDSPMDRVTFLAACGVAYDKASA